MRISDKELRRIVSCYKDRDPLEVDTAVEEAYQVSSGDIIRDVTKLVVEMPDRELLVAELKARIERGEYRPDALEIADAMVRRTVADTIR